MGLEQGNEVEVKFLQHKTRLVFSFVPDQS